MYKSEITETSIKKMNKVELTAYKDVSDCIALEECVNNSENGEFVIEPADYVKLHVENDKSESKEYNILVIIDKSGEKYKTGSEAFERSFMDIFTELNGEKGWAIKVFGKESKNYKGKKFLTCSVIAVK